MFGWVIFRSDTFPEALSFIAVMLGAKQTSLDTSVIALYVDNKIRFEISMALLLALPVYPRILRLKQLLLEKTPDGANIAVSATVHLGQLLFFVTIIKYACVIFP